MNVEGWNRLDNAGPGARVAMARPCGIQGGVAAAADSTRRFLECIVVGPRAGGILRAGLGVGPSMPTAGHSIWTRSRRRPEDWLGCSTPKHVRRRRPEGWLGCRPKHAHAAAPAAPRRAAARCATVCSAAASTACRGADSFLQSRTGPPCCDRLWWQGGHTYLCTAYTHTYLPTYIHTRIHYPTYIHTDIPTTLYCIR